MRYPNVTSLCFATPCVFNAPMEGYLGMISIKFRSEVKGWPRYKTEKKYCRKFQPLSRAHEHYIQQMDLQ